MHLPPNNTISVGTVTDVDLNELFSEPDGGDEITKITVTSSDRSVLLVTVVNEDERIATLAGRSSGDAILTIAATDKGGNTTPVENVIIVNAEPQQAAPLDPQELDRLKPHVVDVSGVFTDSDDGDDNLTITAEAVGDGMDRVTVDVEDTTLTIRGVMGIEPGDVEIVLTATDPHGATVTSSFVATTINRPPTVTMSVEPQKLDRRMPLSVAVSDVFADADGEISMISASVPAHPDDAVIEVGEIEIEDGVLTVTALRVGEATVTLEATDNDGGVITDTFTVEVNNVVPEIANPIADQTLTRVKDLVLNVSETFSDPDTDSPMTYTVKTKSARIARATLDGSALTVKGLFVGSTTITVTATADNGVTVTLSFKVTVTALMRGLRPWFMGALAGQEAGEAGGAETNDPQ